MYFYTSFRPLCKQHIQSYVLSSEDNKAKKEQVTRPTLSKKPTVNFFPKFLTKYLQSKRKTNVLFWTSDNEFLGIIYSLFRGRQNIFLRVFNTKFVVKCAMKILKIA